MTGNGARPEIEQWLAEHGVVEFEYKDRLHVREIDRKASFANGARLFGAVDDDHAVSVALAMESKPETVPPIVAVKTKSGYKILGGNHRYYAAADILDRKTISAYVITQDLSETQQIVLAYTDNLAHGKPTSMEERLSHAAWLVRNRSMTQIAAAKLMSIPDQRLGIKLRRDETVTRMDRLGAESWRKKLRSLTSIERLGSTHDDEVLRAATQLAAEAQLSQGDVGELVTKINRARTVAKQMAIIEEAAKAVQPSLKVTAKGRVPIPKMLMNMKTITGRIERLDIAALKEVSADPTVKSQLKRQTMSASAKLAEIAEAL